MPDGKPERNAEEGGRMRWAGVNLGVALILMFAIGALRLYAELNAAETLALLAATGVFALLSAALLFRTFLRR